MPTREVVSLFGKLPSALDFVRIHHHGAEAIALDSWLQASVQRLAAQNQRWPREPFRFVFTPPNALTVLVGVAAASVDRAGRSFPLVAFARVPRSESVAALALASEAFCRRAALLLTAAGSLPAATLERRLRELHGPQPRELLEAQLEWRRTFETRSLASELLGAAADDEQSAVASLQRWATQPRPQGQPVFDCPMRAAPDVAAWVRLAELAFGSTPSWVCSAHANGTRLLLSDGPLPARVPAFWGNPQLKHAQLRTLAQRV
ncbi:MAG: hypothetical protein RL701_4830 [Pseudomonadota bacterium]|jgi:type VI secretion system ImpM family protein